MRYNNQKDVKGVICLNQNDKFTKEGYKRFTLRIEEGTFETIAWCAKKHKRSIGKEIEVAVDYYLDSLAELGELSDEPSEIKHPNIEDEKLAQLLDKLLDDESLE